MDILLIILNYLVRAMTIAIGLVLVWNPFPALAGDTTFVRTFGGITTIFGIVRTVMYHKNRKKALLEQRGEESDEIMENQ